MADMEVKVDLVDSATVRLRSIPEDMRRRLRVAIVRDGKELARRVRGKLSGTVLKVRSGRLLNSIKSEMVENANTIYGRIYSTGVPYAAIHEHGGQTRPHVIVPRNAMALHFIVGGQSVFAMRVNHPGSKIPKRSYMAASFAEMREELVRNLQDAGRPRWS